MNGKADFKEENDVDGDGIQVVQVDNNYGQNCADNHPQQCPCYLRRRSSGRTNRLHQRRKPHFIRRLLHKNGKATIYRKQLPQHYFRYFLDLGNTLINTHWKWTIVTLGALFFTTWFVFAIIWMLISASNGDLESDAPSEAPCLVEIQGFMGYFLFSIETQSTIGYGKRQITNHCPEAIFLMVVQLILGSGLCGALVSIVYAKMISPNRFRPRASFSKSAVMYQRDGVLCLMFRVRDEYKRFEFHTKINAYLVINRIGGPALKRILLEKPGPLIWPIEIVHKITPSSPFWDLSAKDLLLKRFELIVTMEGLSGATSQASKTSTSYMSTEILWGRRFVPCIEVNKEGVYVVVRKRFNETEEVTTPLCSAKRLQQVLQETEKPPREVYSPSSVYSPSLKRMQWEEIKERDEEDEESSSGIGSLRTDLLSPVSTRSSGTTADLMSPVSMRSNVTVTVDVHRFNEIEEEVEERNEERREAPDNTIYTVHELRDEESNPSENEDEIGRFVYMDEKEKQESSSDSDDLERNGASSPYAKRKPYSIELRRNRVVRQESNRSSGSSILGTSIELRRNRVMRQESNRSSGSSVLATSVELRKNRGSHEESNRSSVSSLIASLQSFSSTIFSRQSSRNVVETHF